MFYLQHQWNYYGKKGVLFDFQCTCIFIHVFYVEIQYEIGPISFSNLLLKYFLHL